MAIKITTKEEFNQLLGTKGKVLIDFYADWCGPCKLLSPVIDEVSKELEGKVVVAKVNTDELVEISELFNIKTIPTIILFNEGEEINRNIGFLPKQQVLNFIEKD